MNPTAGVVSYAHASGHPKKPASKPSKPMVPKKEETKLSALLRAERDQREAVARQEAEQTSQEKSKQEAAVKGALSKLTVGKGVASVKGRKVQVEFECTSREDLGAGGKWTWEERQTSYSGYTVAYERNLPEAPLEVLAVSTAIPYKLFIEAHSWHESASAGAKVRALREAGWREPSRRFHPVFANCLVPCTDEIQRIKEEEISERSALVDRRRAEVDKLREEVGRMQAMLREKGWLPT